MEITGNLCEIQGEIKFEWKIRHSLLLKRKSDGDAVYFSQQFSFYGVTWVIKMYTNGETSNGSVGYVGLYLEPKSLPKPVTMSVTFGFRTVAKEISGRTSSFLFTKEQSGWGWSKFVLRSELIKRKYELYPPGFITVICTLKNNVIKNACLDASVQTEDGKGIWKLQQQLREISENGDISDVTLKVKDQEFKSHRCILAARSPVFSAMMNHEMKENVTGIVEIQDVDPKTFSDFLKYLYTRSTEDLTPENVPNLYVAADKYQVEVLKEHCLDYMLENVSIENFSDIYILSVRHNEERLRKRCTWYFGKHFLEIIKTCKWQTFVCKNPILSNDLHIKRGEMDMGIFEI